MSLDICCVFFLVGLSPLASRYVTASLVTGALQSPEQTSTCEDGSNTQDFYTGWNVYVVSRERYSGGIVKGNKGAWWRRDAGPSEDAKPGQRHESL